MRNPFYLLHPSTGIALAVLLLGATGCSRAGLRNVGDSGAGQGDAGTGGDPGTVADGGAADARGQDAGSEGGAAMLELLVGALGGPGDVDGTGTAARFYWPAAVYLDGQGNLFVADRFNHIIRKLVPATGAVTTVAGTPGSSGRDDGVGGAARFNRPAGITGDGAGNLFVADEDSFTIRAIALATGAVSTLAGAPGVAGTVDGRGAAARFRDPRGLATDGQGNLFVADTGSFSIRKVVIATGAVSTLAGRADRAGSRDGTGADAGFVNPMGLAADGQGNLYVADAGDVKIRKIALATAAVTSIAVPVDAGFFNAYDVTTDGAGNLYVADPNSHLIRRIAVASGAVTTLAGSTTGAVDGIGTAAKLNSPSGLAFGPAGDLFVADAGNNAIRRIVIATGAVTTVAGLPRAPGLLKGTDESEQSFDPQGIASDDTGNLVVADRFNCVLRKVVVATGEVSTFAGTPHRCGTADGAGSLWVADVGRVRRVVLATAAVTTLAGSRDNGYADGLGASARFYDPAGLATDGAGNLFVADFGNHAIRSVVIATGEVSTLAGSPPSPGSADGIGASARFSAPEGVASDGAGNLLVADSDNHTIRRIALSTRAVTTLAGSPGQPGSADGVGSAARFNHPRGLAVDGTGSLYVADSDNHTIRKVALATQAVTTVVGIPGRSGMVPGPLPASLGCPASLRVGAAGELYITDDCERAVLVARF